MLLRLYLDEHVPVALSPALAAHGIDCLTTRDAGNRGAGDEFQLDFATKAGRALVTFNHRDFVHIATQWESAGRSHAGILLSAELPLSILLRHFRRFLMLHGTGPFQNQVVWLPPVSPLSPPQRTSP